MPADEPKTGIWLEVAEVQFDQNEIKVQLKGDRAHPKPDWWRLNNDAIVTGKPREQRAYDTYRAILNEMDKKRVALALLSHESGELRCTVLRFQSADLAGRAS